LQCGSNKGKAGPFLPSLYWSFVSSQTWDAPPHFREQPMAREGVQRRGPYAGHAEKRLPFDAQTLLDVLRRLKVAAPLARFRKKGPDPIYTFPTDPRGLQGTVGGRSENRLMVVGCDPITSSFRVIAKTRKPKLGFGFQGRYAGVPGLSNQHKRGQGRGGGAGSCTALAPGPGKLPKIGSVRPAKRGRGEGCGGWIGERRKRKTFWSCGAGRTASDKSPPAPSVFSFVKGAG